MIFLAVADERGRPWASVLTGSAGFIQVPDPGTLRVVAGAHPGDPIADSLGARALVGTVAVDFATRRRARVNGRVVEADETGLTLAVDQAYANCPKYIQRREDGGGPEAGHTPSLATRAEGLTDEQRQWIRGADTFFVATVHAEGGADASHRGGNPGFVRVDGDNLEWPDYAGNTMFNTLGNIAANPRGGLLFLDFEQGRTLQVTGRAGIEWDPGKIDAVPGAERLVHLNAEEAVEITGRLPFRLALRDYSPFNPKLSSGTGGG